MVRVGETRATSADSTAERRQVLSAYGFGSDGLLFVVSLPNSDHPDPIGLSESDLERDYPVVVSSMVER